jgi:transcriptional regulator with XRE-family HTH domain
MRIKENLNFLLEERGMMKKFLAEKLKVSKANISRYLSGQTVPPIDKLIKLCDIFQVDLTDFVLSDLSVRNNEVRKVGEPKVSYERSLEKENRDLQARVNELELALHRHIKDPDILRKYLDDA